MKTLLRQALLPLAALIAASASTPAHATTTLAFSAHYSGTADVIEVIDQAIPLLRFRTFADGAGSLGLDRYFSTDVIDMSTGTGTGVNVFTAANGDELHGRFDVQVLPTAQSNVVQLTGQATFVGGTGAFSGASGSALFTGTGVFTSATSALADFNYSGQIALVPEPGAWLLMSAGMAALALRRGLSTFGRQRRLEGIP